MSSPVAAVVALSLSIQLLKLAEFLKLAELLKPVVNPMMNVAQSTDFSIDQTIADHADVQIALLKPQGNIDISTAETFKTAVQQAAAEVSPHVVVNLAEVPLVDSSGLTTFITSLREINDIGGTLRISNIKPTVKFVFEITTLDTILDIYETEEQALSNAR